MQIIHMLLKEMEQEAQTTRKFLPRVPIDKLDWKPHPRSMTMQNLATHVAELPTWITMVLNTTELDFATAPYEPKKIASTADLMDLFEKSLAEAKLELAKASEDQLLEMWTLRNGDKIYSSDTKEEVTRMTFCQIVHHRAQLGVYLRLLDIPIPGSYGPSADENEFA
jgi:uncharacterized damage-inducible protein DinB